MKKRAMFLTLIPLLGLSACIVPEEEDHYKDPSTFVDLINELVEWECYTSNENYKDRYQDYGGLIKDQIARIDNYERVKKLEDTSCNYFTYLPDCNECDRPSITVYENGNININIPHWLARANNYYYKIDAELGLSIYDGAINAIDYYIESQKENYRKGNESVQVNNFFANVKDTQCSGRYSIEIKQDGLIHDEWYTFENDSTIEAMIKNLSYSRYTEDTVFYSKECFTYRYKLPNENINTYFEEYYYFSLTESFTLVSLGHVFFDNFNRRYDAREYYLVPQKDGKAIRNYVLEYSQIHKYSSKKIFN